MTHKKISRNIAKAKRRERGNLLNVDLGMNVKTEKSQIGRPE